jgi:hypothetical protein
MLAVRTSTATRAATPTARTPTANRVATAGRAVTLRYLARPPIRVRGTATGVEYRFSAAEPLQQVAPLDAENLLASGHFRREH